MDKAYNAPRLLILSTRLYQRLLSVYPFKFRQSYGGPMLQLFRDCSQRALYERGIVGLLTLLGQTLLDALKTAIEEHSQRGVEMTKEKLTILSGWAFIVGGLSFFLGGLAGSRPEYHPSNFNSLGIDRIANEVTAPLIFTSLLLISLGLLGILARFGPISSKLGRFFLAFGAVNGLVAAGAWVLVTIGIPVITEENGWYLFMFCISAMFLGLGLWGIECLRQRYLARGNGFPLLASVWLPLIFLISGAYEAITGNWLPTPMNLDIVIFGVTSFSLVGLGYLLLTDSQAVSMISAAS